MKLRVIKKYYEDKKVCFRYKIKNDRLIVTIISNEIKMHAFRNYFVYSSIINFQDIEKGACDSHYYDQHRMTIIIKLLYSSKLVQSIGVQMPYPLIGIELA